VRAVLFAFVFFGAQLTGATLRVDTLNAWDKYIRAAESRLEHSARSKDGFLIIDSEQSCIGRLRAGEIVVAPSLHSPLKIPGGLIHDWTGTVFIPNATLDDVFGVVNDYDHYSRYYKPGVLDSQSAGPAAFEIVLTNTGVFGKTVKASESVKEVRIDNRRRYTVTSSTRIQEIEDYGRPDQHLLPPDEGSGYLWRIYSIAKYEARDGGVYVEVEAIALSRDIPIAFKWIAEPIVKRVSRSSLETALQQTRDAILTNSSSRAIVAQRLSFR